jgi:hypothetical protein
MNETSNSWREIFGRRRSDAQQYYLKAVPIGEVPAIDQRVKIDCDSKAQRVGRVTWYWLPDYILRRLTIVQSVRPLELTQYAVFHLHLAMFLRIFEIMDFIALFIRKHRPGAIIMLAFSIPWRIETKMG